MSAAELYRRIDEIADQLSACVAGDFDYTVRIDVDDEVLEKLQIMVNLALDTARRALQEANTANLTLIQAEKMAAIGRLVAGVSHELNTPIGSVASARDTLTRAIGKLKLALAEPNAPDPEKVAGLFRLIDQAGSVIENGCSRVSSTLAQLRSFARLDESDRQVVDIHEGLEDTLSLLAFDSSPGLVIERTYGQIPPIACYPALINQVFLNILANAREAMGGHGAIRITTEQEGRRIHVTISDTGPGFTPEVHSRLFEPGFTTKGNRTGMGLGLAICYRIVRDHGGTIMASGDPGRGATFDIYLPIAETVPAD